MSLHKVYVHIVWRTKDRIPYIKAEHEREIYKCITDLVEINNCTYIVGNGTEDHVHLLINLNVNISLSELMKSIKGKSSYELKNKGIDLNWNKGYGANSIGKLEFEQVKNYILKQKEHHDNKSTKIEYEEF